MGTHESDPLDGDTGRPGFLGREFLELGTLLFAAGAAHLLVLSLGHSDNGGRLLIMLGAVLLLVSALHRWRRHRARLAAARRPRRGSVSGRGGDRLWRIRAAVADVPGGLAALTAQIARLGVDIRLMQVHPGDTEAIDEFYVSAPLRVGADRIRAAVTRAGGREPVVEPADVHELSDTTSRALSLAAGIVNGTETLERALAALSGAHEVDRLGEPAEGPYEDDLAGTAMTLSAPQGGVLVVRRAGAPFTPVEFARCRALVQVTASLESRLRQR